MKPPIVITVVAACAFAIVPVNSGQDMFATQRAQDDASLATALQINAQSQMEENMRQTRQKEEELIAELQRQNELLQQQLETLERPKSAAERDEPTRKAAVDRSNAQNMFSYQQRISSYNFATPSPVAVAPATDPIQNPNSPQPAVADQITQLQEQIETLQKQQELEKQQLEQQIERQTQFARTVRESEAELLRLYPDAGITGSVFANKMIEIADRLEKQQNPLVYEADSPLKIAHMAAKELGIAPR
jgi:DNA repair exonuclease SbcCD ATPase subunit